MIHYLAMGQVERFEKPLKQPEDKKMWNNFFAFSFQSREKTEDTEMIPAGNFSSIGMKSVTSLRRAVFTTTSQSSPMLRRRRTSTSTTTTTSEERDVRRRSLSSHSFEKLERSDSWSSAVVGRRHSRRSSASLSTSSVENLATLHFSKAEKDRGPTFESRGTNFFDDTKRLSPSTLSTRNKR